MSIAMLISRFAFTSSKEQRITTRQQSHDPVVCAPDRLPIIPISFPDTLDTDLILVPLYCST